MSDVTCMLRCIVQYNTVQTHDKQYSRPLHRLLVAQGRHTLTTPVTAHRSQTCLPHEVHAVSSCKVLSPISTSIESVCRKLLSQSSHFTSTPKLVLDEYAESTAIGCTLGDDEMLQNECSVFFCIFSSIAGMVGWEEKTGSA